VRYLTGERVEKVNKVEKWTAEAIDKLQPGRDIDALVGDKVVGLPGVGYYKRRSVHTTDWTACAKGDVTDDHPEWKANLYYLPGVDESIGVALGMGPRAVPRYSSDIGATWKMEEWLEKLGLQDKYSAYLAAQISKDSPSYLWGMVHAPLIERCRAALKTVLLNGR